MKKQKFALFGVAGPIAAYLFIVISIILSPWFNWSTDALSDLGHASRSDVAPLFNFGLHLAGFLIMVFSMTVFRKHAKFTSLCLLISALMLQLVAVFDEVYGFLHFLVSIFFFASLGFA